MEVKEAIAAYRIPDESTEECWHSDVGPLPKGWQVGRLHELASIRTGIAKNGGAEIGYLDLSEMSQLKVRAEDVKRYAVLPGDMLMNEGEVLKEMEADTAATEAKLAKARLVKQGMMQELLTGRIRLVQPASNVVPLSVKPAAAHPPPPQPPHSWQINEAVVIGVLAQRFGTEKFPLPRKRRVKLTYLLHRHAEGRAEGYLKKAAGPYDPNTKYKGPEAIALKNGYVRVLKSDGWKGSARRGKHGANSQCAKIALEVFG